MDREVLDLVIRYPDLVDHLSKEYRVKLLRLWLESGYSTNLEDRKMETTALLYVYAKKFKISAPQIFLAEYLYTTVGAIDQRLYNARKKGLIKKAL